MEVRILIRSYACTYIRLAYRRGVKCRGPELNDDIINKINYCTKVTSHNSTQHKFDLVLLDLAMPEVSGIDLINFLKEQGLLASDNVLIFTASSDAGLLEEFGNWFEGDSKINQLSSFMDKYRAGIRQRMKQSRTSIERQEVQLMKKELTVPNSE